MTKRLLQGGEDVWPNDGPGVKRGTTFFVSGTVALSIGDTLAGGGTTAVGTIWIPPTPRLMILKTVTILLSASSGSGGMTQAPGVVAEVSIADGSNNIIYNLAKASFPYTDWTIGGGLCNYPSSAAVDSIVVNSSGPNGVNIDTGTYSTCLQGSVTATVAPYSNMYIQWPVLGYSHTGSRFICTLTADASSGGTPVVSAPSGLTVAVVLEGIWNQ